MTPSPSAPTETPARRAFYDRLTKSNMSALWNNLAALVTVEPASACVPYVWNYKATRAAMMEAGALITAKEAERRVLVFENPGLSGHSKITTSLYAGLQMVLPGEVAPAHRHSQSALRFVLEGSGAYTAVNGERTRMEAGDFVITPSGAWHDHGNQTKEPMFWLDGLDIPLIQFLDASFLEHLDEDEQPISRPEGDALARYGSNMLPIDQKRTSATSPIFNYPYQRSREALEVMRKGSAWDACHGLKMRYINPTNGDFAMPTIATCLQLLPKGFTTSRYRSTDATVFSAIEGSGRTRVGDTILEWGPRDVFVVPSWKPVVHETASDAVLFSFSDRVVQEKLGIWREERGNA